MSVEVSAGNFFEDFHLGQVIEHIGGRTLTEGDNALYVALTGDRYPLYSDAEFARSLGYRRELINDLLVFHIVFGKTVPDISRNAVANLGYADVRWLAPVYAGDTLRVRSTVIGLKENSNGKSGNVYVRTEGVNQEGSPVLHYCRWVMVHKRDHRHAPPANPRFPNCLPN
jgi:2-methylfumaryl-CoA hydratase